MEENELYSSSTTGESLGPRDPMGVGGRRHGLAARSSLPALWLPWAQLISSASLPGFLVWLKVVGTQPAALSPLAQAILPEAEGLGLDSLFVGPEVIV